MQIRICSGTDEAHLQISKIPVVKTALIPTADQYSLFQGNLQAYWNSLIDTKLIPGHCWRTRDGIKLCSGHSQILEVIFAIPIFLLLEPQSLPLINSWDCPAVLHALPNIDANLRFDLVGRVLHGNSHFLSVYAGGSGDVVDGMYLYDGLVNGGNSRFVTQGNLGGTDSTLRAAPTGFRTHAVIYRLQGGSEAQDRFYTYQTTLLSGLDVSISPRINRDIRPYTQYTGSDFKPLSDEKRFWLKYPIRSTAEYVQAVV